MTFQLDETLVRKLLATVDAGLSSGLGEPIPGKMCVEAAICYALGEGHGDKPSCVEPAVRAAKIALNDKNWSSPAARAKGLRSVAIAQLGSRGVVDPRRFVALLSEKTIRRIVPIALRAAAARVPTHADSLAAAAVRCEQEGTLASARNGRAAADAATYAAARAAYAADAATYAAARAATYAAYAADAATYAAARAATYAADAAAYAADAATYAADADEVLSLSASFMVEVLRECGSPGCEWLWLVEETA